MDPGNFVALLHHAQNALFDGNYYTALMAIEMGIEIVIKNRMVPSNLYYQVYARVLDRFGFVDESERVCRVILQRDPEDWATWSNWGRINFKKGNLAVAHLLWAKAFQLAPSAEVTKFNWNLIQKKVKTLEAKERCQFDRDLKKLKKRPIVPERGDETLFFNVFDQVMSRVSAPLYGQLQNQRGYIQSCEYTGIYE